MCVLLNFSGKSIYQWKRLKVGVYALSQVARREKKRLSSLFDYEFNDWCYIGPTDFGLENDLKTLEILGYIQILRRKIEGDWTHHSEYILTEKGLRKAREQLASLTTEQLESLEKITEDLKKEKEYDAIALYSKYAKEWGREQASEFRKTIRSILSTASPAELAELVGFVGDNEFLKQYGVTA
jgi:hypothetical protein